MDPTTSSPREREERFREIYNAAYVDLLRFVRRRVHPTHAEDVVGDVMLVAWRRLDDVPDDLSAARAWLLGVARKTLQNTRRRDDRRDAVAVRLTEVRHGPADADRHPDLVAHRVDIAAAWPLLSAVHQEAIALSVLDGLTAPEAAAAALRAYLTTIDHPNASKGGYPAGVAPRATSAAKLISPVEAVVVWRIMPPCVAMGVISPAQAAGGTCQDRPATIVGAGPDIQGTPGDDVIVTGASEVIYANAGNDLVCIPAGSPENVYVDAGEGDDVVDTSASSAPRTVVNLGVGRDHHIGGLAIDEVYAHGSDDMVGANFVIMSITGPVTGRPGTYSSGPDSTTGPSTHGPHVVVRSASQDVEVDLEGDVVLVGGVHAADLAGFRAAGVVAPRAVVRGNSENNFLRASGCQVLIDGGDGNDVLDGYSGEDAPKFECVSEATMRGGPGDDVVTGWLGRNQLFGNAGNDALTGRGLLDLLVGGSGRDDLDGRKGPDVLRGSSGNDTLNGKQGPDRLFGNRGYDRANGHEGRDRCIAERERRCER